MSKANVVTIVMTPRLMQLRRVVIGEAGRFPELGKALYDGGPGRAIKGLAAAFARWAEHGLLAVDKPSVAAEHFNWLVMGGPINRAMLLGDEGIPGLGRDRRNASKACVDETRPEIGMGVGARDALGGARLIAAGDRPRVAHDPLGDRSVP